MPTSSFKTAALALAITLAPVDAFWRMTCPGRLILERIDPIVTPDVISGHVHTVSGGSGFGFTTDFAQMRNSACSSCPIKADMSAYWTPKLYWRNKDGTQFKDVAQAGEYNGKTGGMTVYYQQRYSNSTKKVQAFPEGFRMVAGSPFARNFTNVAAAPGQAVSFMCLDYTGGSKTTNNIPNRNCPDGLRAQLYFPSCWDGVNVDSANHQSHMAYPIDGSYDNGKCPSTHPVRLISLFFEVIYSINDFKDQWWSATQHPFVFAMGDTTGYGFHGDFINGWDVNTLQLAADTCTNDSGNIADCPVFNNGLFTDAECQACRLPTQIDEQTTGDLTALPGCNPISSGPGPASPGVCTSPSARKAAGPLTIGPPKKYYTDMTSSQKWAYKGCATDRINSRTFKGASKWARDMTVASCITFCKSKGFSLAGVEYGSECYCDNTYKVASAAPKPNTLGGCAMPCAGDKTQICGGGGAMSVYGACSGPCANAEFKVNGTIANGGAAPGKARPASYKKRHMRKHIAAMRRREQ